MKNRILISITVLFLITQLHGQTQQKIPWPSLANSPWPVGRGDVQGTGRSEYVGPKNPVIQWEKTYPYGMVTGPVIGEEGNLYFGTFAVNWINENYFYCADSLGNEIWRFATNSWVANDCAPAVASNGDIYFGSDNNNFYSLDTEGFLNWLYESNSAFDIENVVLDRSGNIYTGSEDSLYSFNSEGNIRFKLGIPGIIGSALVFSPSGDTLYVHSTYPEGFDYFHDLYAISTNGDIYWSKQFDDIAN